MQLRSDKRQKNQLVLAFWEESRREAPKTSAEGAESLTAKRRAESPIGEGLMEEVCERENCKQVMARVKANKGSPAVEGMTGHDLAGYLKQHGPAIREQLLSGTYTPQPVRGVEIPKPDGGVRKLDIPTVLDRFIQQAVIEVLQDRCDRTFSQHSYGFRPGVRHIRRWNKHNNTSPKAIGSWWTRSEPASRRAGDEKRSVLHRYQAQAQGERAEDAVAEPWERKFLGFRFTNAKTPKRRIAPKAVVRFKERVRELTSRTRGVSIEWMAEELARYLDRLLRQLPNAKRAAASRGMDQTPAAVGDLEAVEAWANTLR